IFRAIRYESRYGFRMDEHTAGLARSCIEMGLVGDLSSERLRNELVDLLEEDELHDSILRLAELGADRAVHPHLAADEHAAALISRARELSAQYTLGVPAWRIGLPVLARNMRSDEVYDWLARLKVRRRDVEHVASAVAIAPRLVELLAGRDDATPAEVVDLAD